MFSEMPGKQNGSACLVRAAALLPPVSGNVIHRKRGNFQAVLERK
jgi:hypothetical protein